MQRKPQESCRPGLALVLRVLGIVDLLAMVAVVMPLTWMSAVHDWSDLGPLPESKIVSYLARTTSALYSLHGALLVLISFDVPRYIPLIRFLAVTTVIHGMVLLGIDLSTGMPLFWTAVEGPAFASTGVLLWWLVAPCCPSAWPDRSGTGVNGEEPSTVEQSVGIR